MPRENLSSANWDDPNLFREVAVGLYYALEKSNGLTPPVKDGFIKYLAKQGHVVTWNAFRSEIKKLMAGLREKGYTFTESALRLTTYIHLCDNPHSSSSTIMAPRGWSEESHMALLHAFIDEIKPGKQVVTALTQRMKDAGWSYSYDAVNQHIQKLRRNRDTSAIDDPAAPGAEAPAPKSKAKPKAAAASRKRPAPKASKLKKEEPEMEDDADLDVFDSLLGIKPEPGSDHEDERPAKKAKNTPSPLDTEFGTGDGEI